MADFIPVWRDTKIQYNTSADYINYTIYKGSSLIYTGKAYKRPNTGYCEFKINKIIENYLRQGFIEGVMTDAAGDFNVYINGGLYNTYYFFYNYDYTTTIISNKVVVLGDSINNKTARGGKLCCTILNATNDTVSVPIETLINGNWTTYKTETIGGNRMYNGVYEVPSNALKMRINGVVWDVVNCPDYQLIYLNKYGGFEVVNLNGRLGKSDEIVDYRYGKSYDNTSIEFENGKYMVELRREYKGYIYFLNRTQAERLDNLYGSTQVYLYDIKNGRYIPVVIEDKKLDYQSNKKLLVFEISIKESQGRVR